MTRLPADGIPFLGQGVEAGSAFVLDEPASADATADVGEGWTVEIRQGSRIVVARTERSESPEEVHALGTNAAQRGLDLFTIRGVGNLHVVHAEDENVTWWRHQRLRTIRLFGVSPISLDVPPITVRVTDPSGNEVPPPPEPVVVWHPSFRYFRLAQVSEEVFDAYRNLYLALESILSTKTPPRPNERDADWIGRALNEAAASGLNLADFAPKDSEDPADSIRKDLYSATRTATFHAKADRDTRLPLDAVDRAVVLDALSRLARLWLALVERTLGVRRPGGGFFRGGFDMLVRGFVEKLEIHVTDDPSRWDPSDTIVNPAGGLVKALTTRLSPELDQPFLRTLIGEIRVEDLSDLTHLARAVSVRPEGELATALQLEGHVTLGGFDVLQVAMGIRGLNVRQPRSSYRL